MGNRLCANISLYCNLPNTITTRLQLYAVFVHVAEVMSGKYESRMLRKGLTPTDVADELFAQYLDTYVPKWRRRLHKGKKTEPSMQLALPIKKSNAFAIIQKDVINFLCKKTAEEKGNVTLISFDTLKQRFSRTVPNKEE